jgi:putative membrane protein
VKTLSFFSYFTKGMIMSISQLIPGVSGSTIAIILGIYDRLLTALNQLTKNVKEHGKILLAVCLGAVIGIILFANSIKWLLAQYPILLGLFFIGVILGGAPLMYQKATEKSLQMSNWLYFFVGLTIVLIMGLEIDTSRPAITELTVWNSLYLFLGGIVFAVALILPGISGSFMLLVLGLYQTLLDAASTMNIYILAPIGIGTLVGTFLTARVIEWLLNRFPQPTYLLILGFVLGSIVEIFPGWPQGYFEWFIGLSVFAIGFLFVYKTSKI